MIGAIANDAHARAARLPLNADGAPAPPVTLGDFVAATRPSGRHRKPVPHAGEGAAVIVKCGRDTGIGNPLQEMGHSGRDEDRRDDVCDVFDAWFGQDTVRACDVQLHPEEISTEMTRVPLPGLR
jgi:hypothetical protein